MTRYILCYAAYCAMQAAAYCVMQAAVYCAKQAAPGIITDEVSTVLRRLT